jgi:hypothetical protein
MACMGIGINSSAKEPPILKINDNAHREMLTN